MTIRLLFYITLISICVAAPFGGHGSSQSGTEQTGESDDKFHFTDYFKKLGKSALNKMKSACDKWNYCKRQSEKVKKLRSVVKLALTRDGEHVKGLLDGQAERLLSKILEAKKALFKIKGLDNVEPRDNGLFGGDMLLNEGQAQRIINRTKGIYDPDTGDVPLLPIDQLNTRRKRGDLLALDYYAGNKWPTTNINFAIGKSISSTEAKIIRSALKSISDASCVKYVEQFKYPVLEFVRTPPDTDAGTCGWAQVGYQGSYNAVNLNFDSSVCKSKMQGVIVHEILHAMGFMHEHTRYDRDKYMTIDWDNVDPQAYDVFDVDDPNDHNPYCVPFDPLSIMQYDPYVGSIDGKIPVMVPKKNSAALIPKMGQGTRMADSDIKLLNRMYCVDKTCKDQSTNCGWSACGLCSRYASKCPKSCGQCTAN